MTTELKNKIYGRFILYKSTDRFCILNFPWPTYQRQRTGGHLTAPGASNHSKAQRRQPPDRVTVYNYYF